MEEKQIISININNIKDCIYMIRGQKVMLDFDLARIYGYETKNFNRQVKNNIEKFDNDFMFELTKDEWAEILRCKNFTANYFSKSRYLPHAFTEQGIYMLMTVLRGKLAIEQSKQLIKCFKLMKDYIAESGNLLTNTNSYIESKFASYDKRFKTIENKLDIVMDNFINPSSYKLFLIMNGAKIEADLAYQTLFGSAKESIIIVDDYVGLKTLDHLKVCSEDIKIYICSDNVARNGLTQNYIDDFINETNTYLTLRPTNNTIHDRLIVIDYDTKNERLFLSGPSSKDAGNKIGTIVEIDDRELYHPIINKLLEGQ
ncbi:MAG: ORF6N domain-containing protein [Bacilli bacterium]|nr:ORF6N domain-containing protein [Bacilli bacterium]